jgi:L-lactate dehydrogenase (cytochrome)
MVGRAWAWAVAAGGQEGVSKMLEGLKSDIDTALGLTGLNSVTDLDESALYRS